MVLINLLPDRWDGASGFYQGKELSLLPYLLKLYEIYNEIDMISLITTIINESSRITNNRLNKKVKK